ncbi:signal recognition particle-docking protein FtsY [Cardiobacterium valvarum]|uniref:Signal recognition particle receptor FtsY n=1 Tax=Cardiobacterium valvarum F0432 TaxID=797473 RepID=G9ZET9_9GAMM|nr:signal recognition particle-docking protein FtsY [Cardiobacterium valvarum]EHM54343.1 signal recognition particle-docking protein FtsY [Cardiobacterium valvarum F0432]
MVFNWFKKRNKAQTTTPQKQENNAAIIEQPVSSPEESPANDSPSETTVASIVNEESVAVIAENASSEITTAFAAEEAPTNDTDETAPSETTTALTADPISETAAEYDNTPQPQQKPKNEGGYFARIRQGLAKTRHGFANLFLGKKTLDQDLIDDLEAQLLTADVGIEVTTKIIDTVTQQIDRKELKDVDAVKAAVRDHMQQLLAPFAQPLDTSSAKPYVILMTGINGAGKTTTIGKLARHFQQEGKKVMLAAGDTFRAAAVEQLQTWGARHNVPVIAQGTGADAASVAYDALQSATARGVDVLIIDTAGRLHTQDHLMAELQKIKRVIGKLNPDAPHETMLIIDAGNGQNALRQAEQFHKAMQLDSITVTKLDGTAKGGILFAISEKLGIPIRYIGVGEQSEDLRPFNANEFVRALLYVE